MLLILMLLMLQVVLTPRSSGYVGLPIRSATNATMWTRTVHMRSRDTRFGQHTVRAIHKRIHRRATLI